MSWFITKRREHSSLIGRKERTAKANTIGSNEVEPAAISLFLPLHSVHSVADSSPHLDQKDENICSIKKGDDGGKQYTRDTHRHTSGGTRRSYCPEPLPLCLVLLPSSLFPQSLSPPSLLLDFLFMSQRPSSSPFLRLVLCLAYYYPYHSIPPTHFGLTRCKPLHVHRFSDNHQYCLTDGNNKLNREMLNEIHSISSSDKIYKPHALKSRSYWKLKPDHTVTLCNSSSSRYSLTLTSWLSTSLRLWHKIKSLRHKALKGVVGNRIDLPRQERRQRSVENLFTWPIIMSADPSDDRIVSKSHNNGKRIRRCSMKSVETTAETSHFRVVSNNISHSWSVDVNVMNIVRRKAVKTAYPDICCCEGVVWEINEILWMNRVTLA